MATIPQTHSTIAVSAGVLCALEGISMAYIMFEDIVRDEGLVDTRILVGLEMYKRLFGHALMRRLLYNSPLAHIQYYILVGSTRTLARRHRRCRRCDRLRQTRKRFLDREEIERPNFGCGSRITLRARRQLVNYREGWSGEDSWVIEAWLGFWRKGGRCGWPG